jgi:hypothetical protein
MFYIPFIRLILLTPAGVVVEKAGVLLISSLELKMGP